MALCRKYTPEDKIYNKLQKSKGWSELFISVSKGDFQAVRAMIQSGADLNRPESASGETVIYAAILSKNARIVQELIDAGADVNIKSKTQRVTPLLFAVSEGVFEVVKVLLDNEADSTGTMYSAEWTALHISAHTGHMKISKLLIDCGFHVDVRSKYNETPLHVAARQGVAEAVRFFIAKGADVSATCTQPEEKEKLGSNITPLILAAYWGHSKVVDILLKAGADVEAMTSEQQTALHFAAQYGPIKLVNMLLKAGAGVGSDVQSVEDHTPLLLAAKNGHVDIVKALLKVESINVNSKEGTFGKILAGAVENGHFEVVKLLEASGALVNGSETMTLLLHLALVNNKDDVAEYLIEHGANIHGENFHAVAELNVTPLHLACVQKVSINVIKSLVEKGANVNAKMANGMTPLQIVAHGDRLEIVKFLIDHGADCNATFDKNFTVLHLAVSSGAVKTVEYLVTKVLDVNAKSSTLITHLLVAVGGGQLEIVESLLKNGANVNAEIEGEFTPLHFASSNGHLKVAQLLLQHNALVNAKDMKDACTPLFLAVENKHENLVSLLLGEGADVNGANKFGVLPIHVAVKTGGVDIVKLLLAEGAYYNVKVEAENYSGAPLDLAREAGNAKLIVIFELIRKLFSAVIKNNSEQIELCVQAGTIVNAREASGRTALHFAVRNYNSSAVKALLSGGADIFLASSKGDLPLQIAVRKGCITISEILMKYAKNLDFVKYNTLFNAKTTKSGGTVLHIAAEKRKLDIVKFLLRNGAFYNAKNNSGKMPLQLTTLDEAIKSLLISARKLFKAVKKKDGLEGVKRILENDNSVVNAREADNGHTPLYWSILSGHADIALALLSSGADYSLVTNEGATPLHIAASKGNVEIVKVLLNLVKSDDVGKSNEFINAATTNGTVALHFASNVDVVKCLLQAGATFDIRNGEDKTALELTQNDDVKWFLKITQKIFQDIEEGDSIIMNLLNCLDLDGFKAIANTRNKQGQTLVQVALTNGQANIASELLKKLSEIR